MNKKKGMSQILTIIIAASVLMMTALTLVFMTQGGLTDLFTGSNTQSCRSTVQTRCDTTGGQFAIPDSCKRAGLTPSAVSNITSTVGSPTFECN